MKALQADPRGRDLLRHMAAHGFPGEAAQLSLLSCSLQAAGAACALLQQLSPRRPGEGTEILGEQKNGLTLLFTRQGRLQATVSFFANGNPGRACYPDGAGEGGFEERRCGSIQHAAFFVNCGRSQATGMDFPFPLPFPLPPDSPEANP